MVGVNHVLLFKLYDLFHTQSWKVFHDESLYSYIQVGVNQYIYFLDIAWHWTIYMTVYVITIKWFKILLYISVHFWTD